MNAKFQAHRAARLGVGEDVKLVTEGVSLQAKQHITIANLRSKRFTIRPVAQLSGLIVSVGISTLIQRMLPPTFISTRPYSWVGVIAVPISMSLAMFVIVNFLNYTRWRAVAAEHSIQSLAELAAFIAGRRRLGLRQEWAAHLAGDSGHDPVSWEKLKQAVGFLVSAVRYRCSDAADAAWTPVDAILKSRILSNLFVLLPTAAAGCLVLRHEGTLGVVTAAESIGAIGATLYGLIRTGRWWRNVKPPEPKAWSAKE